PTEIYPLSLHDALPIFRDTIGKQKFVWEERTFRLGCSIGVVPITGDSADVAALLSAADSACAAAKEAGRNRVFSFQENDLDLMRDRKSTRLNSSHVKIS